MAYLQPQASISGLTVRVLVNHTNPNTILEEREFQKKACGPSTNLH